MTTQSAPLEFGGEVVRRSEDKLNPLFSEVAKLWNEKPTGTAGDTAGRVDLALNGFPDASFLNLDQQPAPKDPVHRNADGRVDSVTFPNGQQIKLDWGKDDKGNAMITGYTGTDGMRWERDGEGIFHEKNAQGENTDKDGRRLKISVNDSGRVEIAEVARKEGVQESSEYQIGSVITYADGARFNYDREGNLTEYLDAQGKTTRWTYNKGLIDEVTDGDGNRWKRDENRTFHRLNEDGDMTDETKASDAFQPPTGKRDLYGTDGNISANDVKQQKIGDCYFMAALAAMAHQNPEGVKNMITDNKDGTFTVRFPGAPDEPITVEAPTEKELEQFGAESGGVWATVVEKAYRHRTGSVTPDEENGGSYQGVQILSGGETRHDFADNSFIPFDQSESREDTARNLEDSLKNHKIITAGTTGKGLDGWTGGHDSGPLPAPHQYSVLAYDAQSQTVTLRNPWGYLGFDGKEIGSLKDQGNGQFTMSLDDFRKYTYGYRVGA